MRLESEQPLAFRCGSPPPHRDDAALIRHSRSPLDLLDGVPAVRERLRPLRRAMDWLTTGPLVFGNRFGAGETRPDVYLAGDSLSFIDPFTGSGVLSALLTGGLAGQCAAAGIAPGEYIRRCREALDRPFQAARLIRSAIASGWAEGLLGWVPAALLFRLTRP